jgi:hypothetical protein
MTMAKKNNQPTMKKLPAVREAVKELGVEALIGDVRQWVKDKYDLDMSDGLAQTYTYTARKELRERNGSASPNTPKKAVMQASTPPKAVTPPPVQAPVSKGASPGVEEIIEAINVLKGLAQKLGKDNLVKLLDAV